MRLLILGFGSLFGPIPAKRFSLGLEEQAISITIAKKRRCYPMVAPFSLFDIYVVIYLAVAFYIISYSAVISFALFTISVALL